MSNLLDGESGKLTEIYQKKHLGERLTEDEVRLLDAFHAQLASRGESNLLRWTSEEVLRNTEWDERKAALASMIFDDEAIVADYGCGNQRLRDYLHKGLTYMPFDLVARDDRVRKIDFNAEEYNLPIAKYAVFSGTLEYVYDLPRLFSKLSSRSEWVICSYSPVDPKGRQSITGRESKSWVNHLSVSSFLRLTEEEGYRCVFLRMFNSQVLMSLRKF